jgi:hypothetical protein
MGELWSLYMGDREIKKTFKVKTALSVFRREAHGKGLVARLAILKLGLRRKLWQPPSIMGFWVPRGELQAFKEK